MAIAQLLQTQCKKIYEKFALPFLVGGSSILMVLLLLSSSTTSQMIVMVVSHLSTIKNQLSEEPIRLFIFLSQVS